MTFGAARSAFLHPAPRGPYQGGSLAPKTASADVGTIRRCLFGSSNWKDMGRSSNTAPT
jgi:hypothetical protein